MDEELEYIELISNSRININEGILYINKVEEEDAGMYVCETEDLLHSDKLVLELVGHESQKDESTFVSVAELIEKTTFSSEHEADSSIKTTTEPIESAETSFSPDLLEKITSSSEYEADSSIKTTTELAENTTSNSYEEITLPLKLRCLETSDEVLKDCSSSVASELLEVAPSDQEYEEDLKTKTTTESIKSTFVTVVNSNSENEAVSSIKATTGLAETSFAPLLLEKITSSEEYQADASIKTTTEITQSTETSFLPDLLEITSSTEEYETDSSIKTTTGPAKSIESTFVSVSELIENTISSSEYKAVSADIKTIEPAETSFSLELLEETTPSEEYRADFSIKTTKESKKNSTSNSENEEVSIVTTTKAAISNETSLELESSRMTSLNPNSTYIETVPFETSVKLEESTGLFINYFAKYA